MNASEIIKSIEAEQLKAEVPEFRVGDTVKVYGKIKEGNRERIQVFEGVVLKRQGGGARETFTVRKNSNGIGVEKTWPLHSPNVEKIEVVRRGKVRRAKLFYLRDRVGKAAKTKEKVGARIEDREIVVKEEIVPGESVVEEVVTEESVAEAVEANKVVEEAKAAEEEAKKTTEE